MSQSTWFEDILQFHLYGEQAIGERPSVPDAQIVALRKRLIEEEVVKETLAAMDQNDLTAIADGIIDSIVVLIGTGIAYGLDLPTLWNEIHRSNMMKFKDGITKDAGGKVLKPKDWKPPAVEKLLDEQRSLKEKYDKAKDKYSLWTECNQAGCTKRGHLLENTTYVDLVPYCDYHQY